jgi:hypothetical protein
MSEIEARGGSVQRLRLLSALREYADELAADPTVTDQAAEQVRGILQRLARTLPEEVPFSQARRVVTALGQRQSWMSPRTGMAIPEATQAGREATRRAVGVLDEVAAETLGGEAAQAYRGARADWLSADRVAELAQEAMGRQAQGRGISITDYMAAQAAAARGGGPLEMVRDAVFNRVLRARELPALASLSETARAALQRVQRAGPLPQWARTIMGAAQRGTQAATAAHFVLSQTDPEYRAALAQESTDERAASE